MVTWDRKWKPRVNISAKRQAFAQWGSSGNADGSLIFHTVLQLTIIRHVADYNNNRIQIFDKFTYAFIGKFGSYGSGDGQFAMPQGIAVDDKYIYVADVFGGRIQVFDKFTYSFVRVFARGQVAYPYGLAVDNNYVYAVDQYGIKVFDKFTYVLKKSFAGTYNDHYFNIAVDDSRIYATYVYGHRVDIFDKATYASLRSLGSYGNGDGQFNYTLGVAVDNSFIYVTDWEASFKI